VTTLIKTCRSERKAEDYQQVVSTADQLLAPSLSHLSSRFATICHNYYYVFMTAAPALSVISICSAEPASACKAGHVHTENGRLLFSRGTKKFRPAQLWATTELSRGLLSRRGRRERVPTELPEPRQLVLPERVPVPDPR
jgi:hypothetical protein